MKIIDLEQGSPAWLSWRKTVITATDCPAIMGSSPWSTAYKAWQKKLGLIEEQPVNEAMQRGTRLEPEARAQFIERFGIEMRPAVVESTEFDFLGASLDGISQLGNQILEIKCGGVKLHEQAAQGIIPEYYLHQIQHQLLVTRADKAYYYSYDGKDGICIEVRPDPLFEEAFLIKAREFWKCVAFSEPPALQDSDYKDMSHDGAWPTYATNYRRVCEQIKELEEIKETYRKELFKLCADQNCLGSGIKVMKMNVKGRVDYEQVPELKGLDLDQYRKKATTCWKILTE
jgi:putative phage-type endonuclease